MNLRTLLSLAIFFTALVGAGEPLCAEKGMFHPSLSEAQETCHAVPAAEALPPSDCAQMLCCQVPQARRAMVSSVFPGGLSWLKETESPSLTIIAFSESEVCSLGIAAEGSDPPNVLVSAVFVTSLSSRGPPALV